MLEINKLSVNIGEKEIIKSLDLAVPLGEVHVIMGPNGSGKSSLANVLMGNPIYQIKAGKIFWQTEDIGGLLPEERAHRGLFMSWQYPREILGVPFNQFLFLASKEIIKQNNPKAVLPSVFEFEIKLKNLAEKLAIKPELLGRSLNYGFSGGEKKKMEMLQLNILQPKLAILDETDSGLDVDALKIISQTINDFQNENRSVLLITHYNRILKYIRPDRVHIMVAGKIVRSGNLDLVEQVEQDGYQNFI